MFSPDQYQLLDFAAGRKLERFGSYVLDRPAPAAERAELRAGDAWDNASARFERTDAQGGQWSFKTRVDEPWSIHSGPITLELKLTDFGHLGVFPEQAENWDWIAAEGRAAGGPIKVLNLFAYTGASTLAAAAAGAEVTHVDAAAGVVSWARRNAEASGLADAPIRWIAEDAVKFARRELKRGRRYDAVILDPPSYGHGPRGESWKLDEGLAELWTLCRGLMSDDARFMLLTCHSGELAFGVPLLKRVLELEPSLRDEGRLVGENITLRSAWGEMLHCGAAVRWSRRGNEPAEQSHTRKTAREPRP